MAALSIVLAAACSDAVGPVAPADVQLAKQPLKGAWTVTSLADPGEGQCTAVNCTLRQAIAAAQDGDQVVFKAALSGTVALQAGELLIERNLSIDGGGRITINAGGSSRAIHATAPAFFKGLTIMGGVAGGTPPTLGGGIYSTAPLALSNVTLRSNNATDGGGVYATDLLDITGSTFSDNYADRNGGGLYAEERADISSSTFAGNSAGLRAGGLHLGNGGRIINSTVTGNLALERPGAIAAPTSIWGLTIASSTITLNTAGDTRGGSGGVGGSYTIFNSILAGNVSSTPTGSSPYDCDGGESLGYNVFVTGGCSIVDQPTDVRVASENVFSAVLDPELRDNGGPTPTHALIERGFAVDAGACPGLTVDQRGKARPFDDARLPNAWDGCDIGAFEWHAPTQKRAK